MSKKKKSGAKVRKSKPTAAAKAKPARRPLKPKPIAANKEAIALAIQFLRRGQLQQAESHLLQILDSDPVNASANNTLGTVYFQQGRDDKAIALLTQALAQQPELMGAYLRVGIILHRQGRSKEALVSYERGLAIEPDNCDLLFNYGKALNECHRVEDSIECYQRVITLQPANAAGAYASLAAIYQETGKLDDAVAALRQAIALRADFAEAHRALAMLKKHRDHDDEVRAMEGLYTQQDLPPTQRLHLAFALGKAFDDIKDYSRAFDYWLEGNRLVRSTINYDSMMQEQLFVSIQQTFSKTFLGSREGGGVDSRQPLFIVGMPRSGTSLVEQILASHPLVSGCGELLIVERLTRGFNSLTGLNFPQAVSRLSDQALSALGQAYLDQLAEITDTSNVRFVTDKNPLNFYFMGLISLMLPRARFIHCRRDPMDTCLSIFQRYFPHGHHYSNQLDELGEFYLKYRRLMSHWHEVLAGKIYTLQYEELVTDQETQTHKLLDFCELPFDEACLMFHQSHREVRTASFSQVRKPIYQDSIARWKRYESQLAPLRKVLSL